MGMNLFGLSKDSQNSDNPLLEVTCEFQESLALGMLLLNIIEKTSFR